MLPSSHQLEPWQVSDAISILMHLVVIQVEGRCQQNNTAGNHSNSTGKSSLWEEWMGRSPEWQGWMVPLIGTSPSFAGTAVNISQSNKREQASLAYQIWGPQGKTLTTQPDLDLHRKHSMGHFTPTPQTCTDIWPMPISWVGAGANQRPKFH